MKLETVVLNSEEIEVLHNLDEFQLNIVEFADFFSKQNKGIEKSIESFCQYVVERGTASSCSLICWPQSISENGKLVAVYSETTEANIELQFNQTEHVEK